MTGAWFDMKLEYGLVPQCKIGQKIVRATFHSTTRIVCKSPPSTDLSQRLPISVSLNGQNWIDTDFEFKYFNEPVVDSITPLGGRVDGGTVIYVKGSKFQNLTDSLDDNMQCRWTLVENINKVERP